MTHRFDKKKNILPFTHKNGPGESPYFTGNIEAHPDRLSIPLKRRKPTVWAVWNDLYHEAVSESFRVNAYGTMVAAKKHTFLILTKRASVMADFLSPHTCFKEPAFENIWHGLTVCNQPEADAKIPVFLQVPGSLWLSLEPLLSAVNLDPFFRCPLCGYTRQDQLIHGDHHLCPGRIPEIRCVVLGGETGPGARPLHPDWVRSVRDQCAAAGVSFFLKFLSNKDGRVLDGRTHDSLPWVKRNEE